MVSFLSPRGGPFTAVGLQPVTVFFCAFIAKPSKPPHQTKPSARRSNTNKWKEESFRGWLKRMLGGGVQPTAPSQPRPPPGQSYRNRSAPRREALARGDAAGGGKPFLQYAAARGRRLGDVAALGAARGQRRKGGGIEIGGGGVLGDFFGSPDQFFLQIHIS